MLTFKSTLATLTFLATAVAVSPANAQDASAYSNSSQISDMTTVQQGVGNRSYQLTNQVGVSEIDATSIGRSKSQAVGDMLQYDVKSGGNVGVGNLLEQTTHQQGIQEIDAGSIGGGSSTAGGSFEQGGTLSDVNFGDGNSSVKINEQLQRQQVDALMGF